jgi:hypothetical protein
MAGYVLQLNNVSKMKILKIVLLPNLILKNYHHYSFITCYLYLYYGTAVLPLINFKRNITCDITL